jgi:SAM-dependent methyltransferase
MNVPGTVSNGRSPALPGRSHAWDKRVDSWDHSALPGLHRMADTVLRHAGPLYGLNVADMGSGSGQLTLEVAQQARSVVAVDFSPAMLLRLHERASEMGVGNISEERVAFPGVPTGVPGVDRSVGVHARRRGFHRNPLGAGDSRGSRCQRTPIRAVTFHEPGTTWVRLRILLVCVMCLFAALLARLWFLQVIEGWPPCSA